MNFIGGQGGEARTKSKVRLSCIVSHNNFIFIDNFKIYIILQTVPVGNPYKQINFLSGKTERKSRTATAQWEFYRNYGRNK